MGMIHSYSDYQEVMAYLMERDENMLKKHITHRLPLERYSLSEGEYFFTLCTMNHQKAFCNAALAKAIIDALLWRKEQHAWSLFCYCLMPDHLHFIIQLSEKERTIRNGGKRGSLPQNVLDQVGDFKKFTTTQLWWKAGGQGQLWQSSSYDRVIRYNDSVAEAVAYILNNPVRKKIVEHWKDYPYASIVDAWA